MTKFVGIQGHDDGALVAAQRWWGRDARQRSEQGTYAVQREILKFALGPRGRVEYQLPDGYAAAIEASDEGRHGPGRHKGAGAIHVADGFSHRLAQVCPLMEDELHEGGTLNALALYVVNTVDVEEMILVVVG